MVLRSRDDAASPVVGVLLMLAITVVTASIVWLMSSSVEKKTETAPEISFYKDPGGPSVVVVRVEPHIDWFVEFAFRGTCEPTLNGHPFPDEPGTEADAGDRLTCEPGETLRIIATKPNQQIYQTTFA